MIKIHVVHPITYHGRKEEDGSYSLVVGEQVNPTLDEKVNSFLTHAQEQSIPILQHRKIPANFFESFVFKAALAANPHNWIDTTPWLYTMNNGTPVPDDQEGTHIGTHTHMQEWNQDAQRILVLGGYLEFCVTGYSLYHSKHFRSQNQTIHYIPDLCVSDRGEEVEKATTRLMQEHIFPMDLAAATRLLEK